MMNLRRLHGFSLLGLLFILAASLAFGRPGLARGADVATTDIIIVLASPLTLTLRIGSQGPTIDVVTFSLTGLPGTGAVAGISSGANPVPFFAEGKLTGPGLVTLTADSSQPLADGQGNTISFNQISWQGSGALSSGRFNGTANQVIWQWQTGATFKKSKGSMAFSYDNNLFVSAGTYRGRVTYTLSAQ